MNQVLAHLLSISTLAMARQLISGCLEQLKDMAGPMISGVLGQLGSAVYEMTEEEVKAIKDVGKEVEKLNSELTAIRAVLEDAENRQYKEATVRDWLDKLIDVSHDIDAVLDEWITAIKKSDMEKEEKEADQDAPPEKKVCLSLSLASSWISDFPLRDLVLRRKIASRIKKLNETLDAIAVEKSRYCFNTTSVSNEPERPKTTSFVNMSSIWGRDREEEVLIRKLCEKNRESKEIEIIPIVGIGGIGKTTLAQRIYHADRVKAHFEKIIWICVSETFHEKRVARAILEALEYTAPQLDEMESMLNRIHESIRGKRFLLILDDVWTDDATKWEPLKEALKSGDPESRILVTTRKKEVALMMRAENNMISVELLSDEICWSIFSQLAFSGGDGSRQLEEIGKQIVVKCKGLPLVAKTLGSLMRGKTRIQQWNDVLHSELWELENDNDKINVFAPFWLSYNDLPYVEQRCLLFCSIFPKDSVMYKDNLIQLWMSQGYLNGSKSPEKKGQDCFENLAMRSFFQDFREDEIGNIKSCKMHDIMHDFVQFLTKNDCCIVDVKEEMEYASKKHRHVTLLEESLGAQTVTALCSLYENKGLLTLFVESSYLVHSLCFLNLTRLKTLNLSCGTLERLPEGIEMLIHLRYLDLSGNGDLKALPNSLCDLFNLQTLRVNYCWSLRQLPKEIGKLVNLRHLCIDGCSLMEWLPKGIAKLSCLRTLDMFVVPDHDYLEALRIEDLHELKELQGSLRIYSGAELKNGVQSGKAPLKDKEHLVNLELVFVSPTNEDASEEEILEALEPHPNLESLEISCYVGSTISPNWMMALINLKSLYLSYCSECKVFPPLGKLPSLEHLKIRDFDSVERVGVEFLGIENDENGAPRSHQISFPNLKRLLFWNLSSWEKWESGINLGEEDNSLSIMPSLQVLKIFNCWSLKELPDFLPKTPLQHFVIRECQILKERCREGVGKEWPKISHIPNIQLLHYYDPYASPSPGYWKNPSPELRIFNKEDERTDVMREAQLKFLKKAVSSSKDEERRILEIWYPGDKIPKWFSYQSKGPSIQVKLPPNWSGANFLGFALGFNIGFEDFHIEGNFDLYLQVDLAVDSRPDELQDILTFNWKNDLVGHVQPMAVDSEYVFLFNYRSNSFTGTYDNTTAASFKFYSNKSGCDVKRCGVRPLYTEDVEKIIFDVSQHVGKLSEIEDVTTHFKDVDLFHEPEASGSLNVYDARMKKEEEREKIFHDSAQAVAEPSKIEIEEEEDLNSDFEDGTFSYEHESSGSFDVHEADTKKEEEGDSNPSENNRETETTYSCGCLMLLSPLVDIFRHVLWRLSGSDRESHSEEPLQAADKVLHSIMMELGEHNKRISQHLRTVMPKTSHESQDSLETSPASRVAPSHSTAAEKDLPESPEEIIKNLCSQIIEVRDQNKEILPKLRALVPTAPDVQFGELFAELTSSPSASRVNDLFKDVIADEQHVQVSDEVIHSLRSHLTELRDHNQQILQFLLQDQIHQTLQTGFP